MDTDGFEMPMPSTVDGYTPPLKEIFKYLQNTISAADLVALQEGIIADERILNVYFKILEKIN